MSIRHRAILALTILLLLAAGCSGASTPADTPVPISPTSPPPDDTPSPTATIPEPTQPPLPTPTDIPPIEDTIARLEGLPIDEFMQEAYKQIRLRDPDYLYREGLDGLYGIVPGDSFTNLSIDYVRETQQLESELLKILQAYDRSSLTRAQQMSYDSLEWYLDIHVRGQAYTGYKVLVNPVWGLQHLPTEILLGLPLETRADAERYLARISNVASWVDQVLEGLALNEQVGALPPKYVIDATIADVDWILGVQGLRDPDAEQMEIYANFQSRMGNLTDVSRADRYVLLDEVKAAIEESFIPSYQTLRDRLVYLSTIALEDPDQWQLPGGQEYYAYLLQFHTGTDLTADELHALGLAEVARTQAEIQLAAQEVGYPAGLNMAEINQRMAAENEIITGSALRREYNRILDAAKLAAEDFFDLRTSADVIVRPEPSGPPAYYQAPAPGTEGPGAMPVNLDYSPLLINYNEHVLVHHETIPGHHTQVSLAQELDLPWFQRFYSVNPFLQNYEYLAYVEGWALYAENLAWEMGLYEGEPFANLGRLRLHLLRAVRMVVDTGIHAKGWTLDEAAAYLEETTGISQTPSQLTRYLVNPGYYCSYNIAYIKYHAWRQRAMDQLGNAFDIKEFHNVMLGNGVLPVGILEGVIDDWIETELNG
ncbi:MAG TPA: DUF885 domain-containing protein [Anaerolineae bacterium]|nr:DUF885 domain-containing protein [Anaerolineae bacterium]